MSLFRVMTCVTAGVGWMAAGLSIAAETTRPNVLILLTDDQRADTIGALGNPVIQTPALDSLARSGFVFDNAYCLGSNVPAVCLPSRNMLLSGRAYFRWSGPQAPADQPNLPVSFNAAGYETYHHGKRGNSALLIQEKFNTNKYLRDDLDRRAGGAPGKTIVDDAIEFLKRRPTDRPFCMYLGFSNPHDPRVAAPRYLELYRREQIPLPPSLMPLHPFDNGEQLVRDELLAPWPRTSDEIRRHLHEYYAVITGLDQQIGRLLKTLDDLRLRENTIVVFSSDNGLALGGHGLMGKQSLYDHSAQVPLIFTGPGVKPGRSDALVYLLDIFPTLCELAGIALPDNLDGKSVAPVMRNEQKRVRDTLFLAYRDVQRAVRDARWKLIRYPHIDRIQLFDLRSDPHEMRDLSGRPEQVERIAALMSELKGWQRRLGDSTPLIVETPADAGFTPPTGEELDKLLSRWKMKAPAANVESAGDPSR
ncbi:MAG: arylsulfatase A family protein [Phycisphaerae bacterium]